MDLTEKASKKIPGKGQANPGRGRWGKLTLLHTQQSNISSARTDWQLFRAVRKPPPKLLEFRRGGWPTVSFLLVGGEVYSLVEGNSLRKHIIYQYVSSFFGGKLWGNFG